MCRLLQLALAVMSAWFGSASYAPPAIPQKEKESRSWEGGA